jgi:hydroxymethylbilane synthase/uroporphyrinogen III methyltransferase/synthase
MKIRLGTRKSKLALAQTQLVIDSINALSENIETEIVPISTAGDKEPDKPLSEFGGKGVFVSEIEKALLSGEIDAAVHSAKDLPLKLADGLEVSGVLRRGDYRDVIATRAGEEYQAGETFTVGTSSTRRILNMKRIYPGAVCKDIRGNIETRLRKLKEREYDAVIVAAAALERLDLWDSEDYWFRIFEYNQFIPAACQGIIAIECKEHSPASEIIRKINDAPTMRCFETENYVKQLLGGDCSAPVCAVAEEEGEDMWLHISTDGVNICSAKLNTDYRMYLAQALVKKLP